MDFEFVKKVGKLIGLTKPISDNELNLDTICGKTIRIIHFNFKK
jgi:hypothetical protein